MENNIIKLCGVAESPLVYSHTFLKEDFYSFTISTQRESGASDILNIVVSDRILPVDSFVVGETVFVEGEIRTRNERKEDGRSSLLVFVFANEVQVLDNSFFHLNDACIEGFICKNPIYRKTPLGREVADLLVAVWRRGGKSDYIPCVAWGRTARYCESLPVGTKIKLVGRFQSRVYYKTMDEGEREERIAYEFSASRVEVTGEDN